MFILTKFSDIVRLAPVTFSIPTHHALTSALNSKFANSVVNSIGLCIALFDILYTSDGTIKAGDGCAYVAVTFRMIVFRPFVGEVITGRIAACTEAGLKISLGFFDDILVPPHFLFPGTIWDSDEKTWIWKTPDSDLFLDVDEVVRIRIEEEEFVDITPGKKGEIQEGVSPYSLTVHFLGYWLNFWANVIGELCYRWDGSHRMVGRLGVFSYCLYI